MRTFIFALILSLGITAEAKMVTYVCEWSGWDVAFSTNVDDRAVEVRRAYEYSENLTFYFRIPIVEAEGTWADVMVAEGRKTVQAKAYCIRSLQ